MFALLTLFYIIFEISDGAPIVSCLDQVECLEVEQNEYNSSHSEVCIWFNDDLGNCGKKDDQISHVCIGGDDHHKVEGWSAGADNEQCQIVPCDYYAFFGVKDGGKSSCESYGGPMEFSGVEGIYCYGLDSSQGGLCAGKNSKSCTWKIPSLDCPEDPQDPEDPPDVDPEDPQDPPDVDPVCLDSDEDTCKSNEDCCWFVVDGEGAECRDDGQCNGSGPVPDAPDPEPDSEPDSEPETPETPETPTPECGDNDGDSAGCEHAEGICCYDESQTQCNDNSDGCGCTSCDGRGDLDCGSTDGCCVYNAGDMEGVGECQSTSNAMSFSRDEDENNNELITGSACINNVNVVFFAVLCLIVYIY